jgi:pimeloyl-ACP methyl ester carboxylesterase
LLGFGYSDRPPDFDYGMEAQAEIVIALLRSLGISGCTLVGHSMGGSIAILAAAATSVVDRLVVAEGNLDPGPGMVSGPITSMTEDEFVATGHAELVEGVRNAGFADFAGTLRVCDPAALQRSAVSLIAPRRPTYRTQLARLAIPRTFIYGDKNLPTSDIDQLEGDGVAVRVLVGSGHDMLVDNPDGFAEIVADVVDTN